MHVWESVEISVNKIDVSDVITTSYSSGEGPLVGGDNGSEDIMGNKY